MPKRNRQSGRPRVLFLSGLCAQALLACLATSDAAAGTKLINERFGPEEHRVSPRDDQVLASPTASFTKGGVDLIFADDFEAGNFGAWSNAVGVYVPPPPTIDSIVPSSGWNQEGTRISILGSSFGATPSVLVGTTECTDVVYLHPGALEATVPPGLLPSLYPLTVENPDLQTAVLTDAFRASAGRSPHISDVEPKAFISSDGGSIRIHGRDFDENAQAFLSNDAANLQQIDLTVTAVDAPCADADRCNVLEGTVPSGLAQGIYVLTVVNPDELYDVFSALKLTPTADGKLNFPWHEEEPLNFARMRHGATRGQGDLGESYLYVAGGEGSRGALDLLEYAPVGRFGDLASWRYASPLPSARAGLALLGALTSDGSQYLFAFGGEDGTGTIQPTTYRARVLRRDEAPGNLDALAVAGSQTPGNWIYRVSAVTAEGESLPSELAAITIGSAGISLTWDAVPGVLHYRVYRSDAPDVGSSHLHLIADDVPTEAFVDQGSDPILSPFGETLSAVQGGSGSLAAGSYGYAVSAVTLQGETSTSNVEVLSVAAESSVGLSWNPVAGALFYTLYRTETNGGELFRIAEKILDPDFVDPGLAFFLRAGPASVMPTVDTIPGASLAEGTWKYQIVAVDEQGSSLPSPTVPFSVDVGPGQNAVGLEWEPSPNALSYEIYRTDGPLAGPSLHRIADGVRVASFTDTGRPPGIAPIPDDAGRIHPALGKLSPLEPGSLTTWSALGSSDLPAEVMDQGAVAVAVDGVTFLYSIGGTTTGGDYKDQVYVATVDDAGSLGPWRSLLALPSARSLLTATEVVGRDQYLLTNDDMVFLYAAQGETSPGSPTPSIWGAWVLAADLEPTDLVGEGSVVSGLLVPDDYEYRVAALFPVGLGPASDPITVQVGLGETSVQLTWSPEPDALEYVLYRRLAGSSAPFEQLSTLSAVTDTTYTDFGDLTNPAETPLAGRNGALSPWTLTDSCSTTPGTARRGHLFAAVNGFVYLMLGEESGGSLTSSSKRARVRPTGELAMPNDTCSGTWPDAGDFSYPLSRTEAAGARAAASYFTIGGDDGSGPTDIVESIPF